MDTHVRLRIDDLPEGSSRHAWTLPAESLDLGEDLARVIAPVEVQAQVLLGAGAKNRVRLELRAQTELQITCSRCLEPARQALVGETSLSFDPQTDALPNNPVWLAESGELDLGADVREVLIIELPMQPLCAPDCAGLCARCGTNLNQEQCACSQASPDPRWGALEALRDPDPA